MTDSLHVKGTLMRNIQYKKDKRVKENIAALRVCGKSFDEIEDWMRQEMDMPANRIRKFFAKILKTVLPERAYDYIPKKISRFVAEEEDASEFMEGLLRSGVNDTQKVVRNLYLSANEETEKLEELTLDLEHAQKENWDIQALQTYIAEKVGVELDPLVEELLNERFDLISPNERENRKKRIIARLNSNIAGRKKLIETHGKFCSVGLDLFERGKFMLYDFMTVFCPLRVLRDAAKSMVKMDVSMYAAKDLAIQYLQLCSEAVGLVADSAMMSDKYLLFSPDMQERYKAVNTDLDKKLVTLGLIQKEMALLESKRDEVIEAQVTTV